MEIAGSIFRPSGHFNIQTILHSYRAEKYLSVSTLISQIFMELKSPFSPEVGHVYMAYTGLSSSH
jgi:hypothetical protein